MEDSKRCEFVPYLRSCKQECDKPIEGDVTGEIPKWLKGCLIRVGSGLLEIGPDKFNHVFDGMALMHRFSFRDGNVTYQNRFLRSDAYKKNMEKNRIVVSEFATRGAPDPCKTIFQRFASLFDADNMTDNDLVNIILYGNEPFACSETNNIWKIDPETLESVEKVNIRNFLPVDGALAHAHEDTDGTVYNVGLSYGFHCYYNVIKFPPKDKDDKTGSVFDNGSVVCKVPASKLMNPSYYHSFAMTDNYFILVEQPLYMSLIRMFWAHFVSGTYNDAMIWDPDTPSRFHVIRRSDGQLLDTVYIASPFFVFHHINAYEEDSHIIIDLCAYERGEIVNALYVKALEEMFSNPEKYQEPFESRARRYVLPLNISETNQVNLVSLGNCEATATLQADGSIFCTFELLTGKEPWSPELPRIHYEKYNGKKYKYYYAIARKDTLKDTHLVKVNTETKKTVSWHEPGVIPSEPVFLAEPNSAIQDEDSGILLASLLYRDDASKVSMLVLSAKTMEEFGRVTFQSASAVPGDFHGVFIRKN